MKEEINSINALVETDDRCDDGRREVAASVGGGASRARWPSAWAPKEDLEAQAGRPASREAGAGGRLTAEGRASLCWTP